MPIGCKLGCLIESHRLFRILKKGDGLRKKIKLENDWIDAWKSQTINQF